MDGPALIGMITGIISIATVLFGVAYWKGCIDTKIKQMVGIPETVLDLKTKVDVIWTFLVERVLEGVPKLVQRGSDFKLTEQGEQCMEDVKGVIEEIMKEHSHMGPSDVLTIVAHKIGMEQLNTIAHKNGCSSSQYLALLTVKLGAKMGGSAM